MKFNKPMFTIFDLIDRAFDKRTINGQVAIEQCKNSSYTCRKETLVDFFEYTIELFPFIVSPLYYTKSEGVTQTQKQYIDRISSLDKNNFLHINVIELFELNSLDELKEIERFLLLVKNNILSNCTNHLKLMYENNPIRLVAHVRDNQETPLKFRESTENTLLTQEIQRCIDESPVLTKWTTFIAKNLRNLGRWSWINFNRSSALFNPKEGHANYLALGKLLDLERAEKTTT